MPKLTVTTDSGVLVGVIDLNHFNLRRQLARSVVINQLTNLAMDAETEELKEEIEARQEAIHE